MNTQLSSIANVWHDHGWISQIVEEEALESAKNNNLWCIHIAQHC